MPYDDRSWLNGQLFLHKSDSVLKNFKKHREGLPMRNVAASMASTFFHKANTILTYIPEKLQGIPYEGCFCLNCWQFLHKSNTILSNFTKGEYLGMLYEVHIWMNGRQFLYKSTQYLKTLDRIMRGVLVEPYLFQWPIFSPQIKNNLDKLYREIKYALWGPYMPQWPTFSTQIKHTLDQMHEKYSQGIPYWGRSCLNGYRFLHR